MTQDRMTDQALRHRISQNHLAITGTDGWWRLLGDDESLKAGDQTVCLSEILSLNGGQWRPVDREWADDIASGRIVGEILGPDSQDADRVERLFRRRLLD